MRYAARPLLALTTLVLSTLLAGAPVLAQDYPARPVRIIVPVPPGGVTDLAARNFGPRLNELLGQQFVIENRPGAAGSIGVEAAARAAADGYTLLLVSAAEMTVAPALLPKITFNPNRDFVPVAPVSNTVIVLAAHASQAPNTVRDIVALAKSQPGRIAFASAGNSTINHMSGEWFASLAGIDWIHVPYKGGGPATQDVVGGQVRFGMLAISSALPHVRSGKLKVLGVTAAKRVSFVPDWPTIAEQGYPALDTAVWVGLFAPAGTPAPIVARLNSTVNGILAQKDMRERFNAQGVEVLGGTADELAALMRRDQAKYGQLIKQHNIKPD